MIQFLMNYGNYQFLDAVEELAASVGMEVPREYTHAPQHGEFTQLIELMGRVNSMYQNQLFKNSRSAEARKYLKDRGITQEAARDFGLGYAPDEWDFVLKKFGGSETDQQMLEKAGLVARKDNRTYDRFRGRLMFPIEDRRGRVIAFGGRVVGSGEPKYLNSPETILFKKGNELFGFRKALPAIKNEEKVLVVEGYTDVLGLAQFGIGNAVATLGTAATPVHIKQLLRTTSHVVFCFDGDEAGVRAAWRAVGATLPQMEDGHLVSFVFLPEGQDPDSMVREEGAESFRERMQKGEPITDFIFRVLLKNSDLSRTDGRAKFAMEFGKVIEKLRGGFFRDMMLSELSKRTGLSERAIRNTLGPGESERGVSKSLPTANHRLSLTGSFICMIVQNPQLVNFAKGLDEVAILTDPNIDLLTQVLRYIRSEPGLTTAGLVEKFRSSDYFNQIRHYASIKSDSSNDSQEQEFQGAVLKLRERITAQRNKNLLSQPHESYDETVLQDALQQLKDGYALKKSARTKQQIH